MAKIQELDTDNKHVIFTMKYKKVRDIYKELNALGERNLPIDHPDIINSKFVAALSGATSVSIHFDYLLVKARSLAISIICREKTIQSLDLSCCNINKFTQKELCNIGHMTQLKAIYLHAFWIDKIGKEIEFLFNCINLEHLYLKYNAFSSTDNIITLLLHLPHLETCHISGNVFDPLLFTNILDKQKIQQIMPEFVKFVLKEFLLNDESYKIVQAVIDINTERKVQLEKILETLNDIELVIDDECYILPRHIQEIIGDMVRIAELELTM